MGGKKKKQGQDPPNLEREQQLLATIESLNKTIIAMQKQLDTLLAAQTGHNQTYASTEQGTPTQERSNVQKVPQSATSAKPKAAPHPEKAKTKEDTDGWFVHVPKKSKATKEEQVDEPTVSGDTLLPQDWNVKTVKNISEHPHNAPGVALCSRQEARDAMREFEQAPAPIAVLIKGELEGVKSQELQVPVKDKDGRICIRTRHLIQLGKAQMRVHLHNQPKAVEVQEDTCIINFVAHKNHLPADKWQTLTKEPLRAAKRHMKHRVGVEVIDAFAPRCSSERSDFLSVKCRVPSCNLDTIMNKSGFDGISLWPMVDPKDPPAFKTVWLPTEYSLEAAQRQASRIPHTLGVVCSPGKIGIRAKIQYFSDVAEQLLGQKSAAKASAQRWEVSNVPVSWGRTAMENALVGMGWDALVEHPKYDSSHGTRTWVLSATSDPPILTLRHSGDKLSAVNKVTPGGKPSPNRPPMLAWKRPQVPAKVAWPTDWSDETEKKTRGAEAHAPTQIDTAESQQGNGQQQPHDVDMGTAVTGRRRGAAEAELEDRSGAANAQVGEASHRTGADAGGSLTPTQPVAPPTDLALMEARLAQGMRTTLLQELKEALGPIVQSVSDVGTKIEWLHNNCVTRAQFDAEIEEIREEGFPGFPPGAPSAEDADTIHATAQSRRGNPPPVREGGEGARERQRSSRRQKPGDR